MSNFNTFRINEVLNEFPKHKENTKELVLNHVENHILDEIPPSELYMMCKMLLLREWLNKSKNEITRDIKEVK